MQASPGGVYSTTLVNIVVEGGGGLRAAGAIFVVDFTL